MLIIESPYSGIFYAVFVAQVNVQSKRVFSRGSQPEEFYKKMSRIILPNLQENICTWVFFYAVGLQLYYKRDSCIIDFLWILGNSLEQLFIYHLWTAAAG